MSFSLASRSVLQRSVTAFSCKEKPHQHVTERSTGGLKKQKGDKEILRWRQLWSWNKGKRMGSPGPRTQEMSPPDPWEEGSCCWWSALAAGKGPPESGDSTSGGSEAGSAAWLVLVFQLGMMRPALGVWNKGCINYNQPKCSHHRAMLTGGSPGSCLPVSHCGLLLAETRWQGMDTVCRFPSQHHRADYRKVDMRQSV